MHSLHFRCCIANRNRAVVAWELEWCELSAYEMIATTLFQASSITVLSGDFQWFTRTFSTNCLMQLELLCPGLAMPMGGSYPPKCYSFPLVDGVVTASLDEHQPCGA